MSPALATLVCVIGILGLFKLARNLQVHTSKALWIPVIWFSIGASRMVSQWLNIAPPTKPDDYFEGSPLDRVVFSALLAIGLIVLFSRKRRVASILRTNWPIVLFVAYCAVSIVWSDFPVVAFKRWVKDLGDLTMVLVVLTDWDPSAAFQRLLARAGFVLVPVSILLIKYYPALGRGYHPWTWTPFYIGAAGGKNELGLLCVIFGTASLWHFFRARDQTEEARRGRLIAHGVILVMALWLFWMADSVTSWSCFFMAAGFIAATSLGALNRKPVMAHLLVAAMLCVSFCAVFLDFGSGVIESMGRDPTLTGRTELWSRVLGMAGNSLVGTGFESFWLGPRMEELWRIYWWHPNEAHNGYLEVYLNLGWLGVALLALLLITGYRNAIAAFRADRETGTLRLAYFVVAITYNFTESGIRIMHPMWIILLFSIMAVPRASIPEEVFQFGSTEADQFAEPEAELDYVTPHRVYARVGRGSV